MEEQVGSFTVKKGLAQMLKGGVIMDVVTPDHARIAEEAGAVAVMALERVPADIRAHGGVARMSDPELILQIMDTVTIPVILFSRDVTGCACAIQVYSRAPDPGRHPRTSMSAEELPVRAV